MKINHIPNLNSVQRYRNSQDAMAEQVKSNRSGKKDEVQISAEAKELLDAQQIYSNHEKVQQLKDAVSSGTYFVESHKIAEKLWHYFK